MNLQQQRVIENYRYRAFYGMGDTTQQGDAATVARSLQQSAALATQIGGPLAGAIVSAAAGLANIVALFGPNPNNTITTEWVNQVEGDVLKPNLAAWQALPADKKYYTLQQTAMNTYTQAWNQIVQLCSNPQLGSAGTNCLKDRQRGGKWDWWRLYFDPIANDPQVIPDPVATVDTSSVTGAVSGAVDSTVASVSQALGGISPVWVGVGLIAAALLLVSD
jgi:hypothetical protein